MRLPLVRCMPPRRPQGNGRRQKPATGWPDLQGTWNTGTLTPARAWAAWAGKAFLTEAEAALLERTNPTLPPNPAARSAATTRPFSTPATRSHRPADLARRRSVGLQVPIRQSALDRRDHNLTSFKTRYTFDEPVGSLHHPRTGGTPAGALQQRLPDPPDTRFRRHSGRNNRNEVHVHPARRRAQRSDIRLWTGPLAGPRKGGRLMSRTTGFHDHGSICDQRRGRSASRVPSARPCISSSPSAVQPNPGTILYE